MKLAIPLLLLALASPLAAQSAASGHRLFGRFNTTTTELVDVSGNVLHTWTSNFNAGIGVYLEPDGTLLRTARTATQNLPGGAGGGLQRIAFDDTLLWDFRYDTGGNISHHDVERLPNGNVLMIAWERFTAAEAIAMGRNPNLINSPIFRPDHIIEVQQTGFSTGNIVWEWHVADHLIQNINPSLPNFGVVADHPELIDVNYPPNANSANDFNHCNGIHYDPINDLIVMSARNQNEIWILDHSTTTTEAAGHTGGNFGQGGDLLYRWGNPAAYDRGNGSDQQLFGQHSPRFVPTGYPGEGNITIFNNNAPGGSQVVEIVLPADMNGNYDFGLAAGATYGPAAPIWTYSAPGFFSSAISGTERVPNGNTLICEGSQGRVFEVTPAGNVVFDYTVQGPPTSVFHAHYYEHSLWASDTELSASAGGTIDFDLLPGTQNAAKIYFLLASGSGSSPGFAFGDWTVPLNIDFITDLSFNGANLPPFLNNLGVVAADGRATSQLVIPSNVLANMIGAQFQFAFIVLEPTGAASWASNAVEITLTP